jgi:hypothetical protein
LFLALPSTPAAAGLDIQKCLGAATGRGAGQTVRSFGPNRPFAATLAEKAAFLGQIAASFPSQESALDFSMT